VGEPLGPGLHQLGVLIDPQNVVAETDERFRHCAPEAAETDDDDATGAR
jgi:hypothetical protein